ncbi:Nuclear polyadenylated rna-binding protein nab2 [Apiospora marii]|uniref:Nuclear polyadenylated rna-binding protein nab2 n=1 Tax=Apiospora marii TaxID=335849 RepID=A0ABR1S9E2_9PEZI
MSVEVAMNTPLSEALTAAIQPKLVEVGWASGGDDASLSEYIILMLVNGRTQDDIASELAGDLLSLGPDDPAAKDFARWLFEQIDVLNAQLNGNASAFGQTTQDASAPMDQDMDMGNTTTDAPEFNAPTGPKSMRNGDMRGGARGGKRNMLGQLNSHMNRPHENALHRVRGASGTERISAHGRAPPTGPRGNGGRNNRAMNNRANNIAHGMASQMNGMNGVPPMNGMGDVNWMMQNGAQQGDIFSLLQQQNQMMVALSQQLAQSQQQNMNTRGRGGKSLFERTQRGANNFRRGGHHGNGPSSQQNESANGAGAEGGDVDMSQARQNASPEATLCKFNLSCTNRDCKFAHQSPAAPPGTTIDVSDACSYGAACKNFKCVGRHPSPATKRAHQNDQECKFYPNCTNPKCPFKHPDMPACRNGGDCKVEGCKFTHVTTMCRFNPCTNRYCHYKHEDGQRGKFQDKVWTADGSHVSDRKFVEEGAEELVVPGAEENAAMDESIA